MNNLIYAFRRLAQTLLVLAVVACALPLVLPAANLLPNPGFETPAAGVTPGVPVTYTSHCLGGKSAAASWLIWNNTCGTNISTTLVPSTAPGGQQYMMHVVTNGANNGLYVNFAVHPQTVASIWVYLNSGCIGIGTGNGPETGDTDEMTCVTGRWFQLYNVPNGVSPASEFIVYTIVNPILGGNGAADFYVDSADVEPQPLQGAASTLR